MRAAPSPHNGQAPWVQEDVRDSRRYGLSFFVASATIVDGDTVMPMPTTLMRVVLYVPLARHEGLSNLQHLLLEIDVQELC